MNLLIDQIRDQYRLLNHGSDYTRVRCGNADDGRTISESRIRGINELIDWAKEFSLKGNLYIGRNPVDAKGEVCRATSWSVDIDPKHPPRTACSTDELSKALRVGERIRETYGDGCICTSGNGALLLFSIPGNEVSDLQLFQRQCQIVEKQIREQFQTEEVRIDATYDIARLVKLMGSVSVKGDKRYWRHARFITKPVFHSGRRRVFNVIKGTALPQSDNLSGLDSQTVSECDKAVAVSPVDAKSTEVRLGPGARLELAEKSLRRLAPSRADDYDSWLRVGIILKEFGPAGFRMWKEWSDRCHTKERERFEVGDMVSKFNGFRADQTITVGTLKHWADTDDPAQQRTGTLLSGVLRNDVLRDVSGSGTVLWFPGQPISSGSGGQDNSIGMRSLSTGYKWLDGKLHGGYRSGVVYGIEAATNVGKSAFLIQAARYLCEAGHKVLFVTTENSIEEVCQRYWAVATGLSTASISNGSLTEDGRRALERYQERFREHKLGVWYTTSPNTAEIERQINEFKPDIILWDYFQHFETGTESRQIQLGSLARWYESTAIKYSLPVVVAAQLHERYDFKNNKRMPSHKGDVKDCKTFNDVCKTVIVLDWTQTDQKTEDGPVLVRVALDKNKGGQGETRLLLHRAIPRFDEI